MRGIARQQHAAGAECRGNALMDPVDRAMNGFIPSCLWHHRLQALFYAIVPERLVIGLVGPATVQEAPQARRTIVRQTEDRAPLDGMRNICGVGKAALTEIVGRADQRELFRIGETVEGDVCGLAHDAAAAVGADHPKS